MSHTPDFEPVDVRVRDLLQKIEISPESETVERQAMFEELKAALNEVAPSLPQTSSVRQSIGLIDEIEYHPKFSQEWKDLFQKLTLLLVNNPLLQSTATPLTQSTGRVPEPSIDANRH